MEKSDKLYEDYANQVMKFLVCLTSNLDLSEDLMQETFYQAYKSIHRYNGECKMSTWLCQIAKHLYFDYLKKQKHYQTVDIEEIKEYLFEDKGIEDGVIERENIKELEKAVNGLSEPYRQVLILRVYGEFSFREIAEIYNGKTENWARITFYRAKMKVKEEVKHGNPL